MKARLGMKVLGECGQGVIVAMTRYWCIYRDDTLTSTAEHGGNEVAEPWSSILVQPEPPDETEGSLSEGPDILTK